MKLYRCNTGWRVDGKRWGWHRGKSKRFPFLKFHKNNLVVFGSETKFLDGSKLYFNGGRFIGHSKDTSINQIYTRNGRGARSGIGYHMKFDL